MTRFVVVAYVATILIVGGYGLSVFWRSRLLDREALMGEGWEMADDDGPDSLD